MIDTKPEKKEILIKESLLKIEKGDFQMKLRDAKELRDSAPEDYRTSIILSFSYFINKFTLHATKEIENAVELSNGSPDAVFFRAFMFINLVRCDKAEEDLAACIKTKNSVSSRDYHLRAKIKAGKSNFASAFEDIERAINTEKVLEPEHKKISGLYKSATGRDEKFMSRLNKNDKESVTYLLSELRFSFEQKEYWYTSWLANQILADMKKTDSHQIVLKLLIETYLETHQTRQALTLLDIYKERFGEDKVVRTLNKEVDDLYDRQISADPFSYSESTGSSQGISQRDEEEEEDGTLVKNELSLFNLYSVNMYDFVEELTSGRKTFYKQFDAKTINFLGVEVVVTNPFHNKKDYEVQGSIRWYSNRNFGSESNFELHVDQNWEYFQFAQSFGSEAEGFWEKGTAKVEIYLANELIGKKTFMMGDKKIVEDTSPQKEGDKKGSAPSGKPDENKPEEPADERTLEELLGELDSFIGLESVKQSMRDFVDYLKFQLERKKSGLKSESSFSLHTLYLGNPGTGKTTVARLMGKIFHAMGLLEKGHLVEVDRGSLVGQFIGETAQKTEKIIEDSMGGVLFIDEAYTLYKAGNPQDFGKEAIDTLLKKMEDKSGQFAVIAAGYPDEMETFIAANSGMKSRVNYTFIFEDYNPDELIEILKRFAGKEEFLFDEDALAMIKKHITLLYRSRDKTFGNARLMRNVFSDAKMHLGKRYLKLPEEEKTKEALSLITDEDVAPVFWETVKKKVKLQIDEEAIQSVLDKIERLVGLSSVKEEVKSVVKLARYYYEQKENLNEKFSDHIVFTGNPGTGKTTVARLISQLYSALTILPKGHLVEADRQKFVAGHIGGTAEKTNQLVDQSIGGTLFIDEAYSLIKTEPGSGGDFGKEAIDTLLKRMEDERGKFIVIAAGYTDNMNTFMQSNPGLTSRFTKYYHFEDYTPDELMVLTRSMLESKKLILSDEAAELLKKHYNVIYRARDKNFGNARLARNMVDGIQKRQLLRLVEVPVDERDAETGKIITAEDVIPLTSAGKEKEIKKSYKITGDEAMLRKYLDELNQLTGLESVKSSINKLLQGIKVTKLREARGMKVIQKSLHSVFFGNPGTGKTTVARLISKLYREMGIIEKGHLVEVDRAALVASHVGETAKKTDDVISSALGGTLFIDEAYTLFRGGNDFGIEAIDTLLKRMEDYKDKLVVIVAGYTNEMRIFLEANPGLKSRFSHYFNFEDYTPRQMLEIVFVMSEKNGYILDEGALQLLLEIFENAYKNRDKNFGNARTVRNILMKAIGNQEERILTIENPTDEDLITIMYDDVEAVDLSGEL